jgi:hypothetical protein
MSDYLLSFELNEDKDQLQIHADENGLRLFIKQLGNLLTQTKDGHFNHDHLMTPEWGGVELSSESQGGIILNHVKVYCWKGSEPQI